MVKKMLPPLPLAQPLKSQDLPGSMAIWFGWGCARPYQGMGLAQQLLYNVMVELFAAERVRMVMIDTQHDNVAALQFFRKLGFWARSKSRLSQQSQQYGGSRCQCHGEIGNGNKPQLKHKHL